MISRTAFEELVSHTFSESVCNMLTINDHRDDGCMAVDGEPFAQSYRMVMPAGGIAAFSIAAGARITMKGAGNHVEIISGAPQWVRMTYGSDGALRAVQRRCSAEVFISFDCVDGPVWVAQMKKPAFPTPARPPSQPAATATQRRDNR